MLGPRVNVGNPCWRPYSNVGSPFYNVGDHVLMLGPRVNVVDLVLISVGDPILILEILL